MLLLHLLRHTTGNRLLLWSMEENGGTVFYIDEVYINNGRGLRPLPRTSAMICALGVEGCGVMCAIEILYE